jgi:hypothetical protein
MTEYKSERRERQRIKRQRGMQVSNTSIRLIARLSGTVPDEPPPHQDGKLHRLSGCSCRLDSRDTVKS